VSRNRGWPTAKKNEKHQQRRGRRGPPLHVRRNISRLSFALVRKPGARHCWDRAMWLRRLPSFFLFRKRREHHCSFCNSPQAAVRKLIAGASAFICDECVAICHDIVTQNATTPGERPRATGAIAICLICKRGKPESECILVPACGPVCVQCVETVKASATSPELPRP
jgi:ClpX C4-type zinc finger protein